MALKFWSLQDQIRIERVHKSTLKIFRGVGSRSFRCLIYREIGITLFLYTLMPDVLSRGKA